jgi:predicted ArsR family transcriptional regulator
MGQQLGRNQRRGAARTRLTRALTQGGYEPIEERGTIRLRNCPFDALTDDHRPLVCGTNLALAQGIADGADAATFEPILDAQPGYCCVALRERAG